MDNATSCYILAHLDCSLWEVTVKPEVPKCHQNVSTNSCSKGKTFVNGFPKTITCNKNCWSKVWSGKCCKRGVLTWKVCWKVELLVAHPGLFRSQLQSWDRRNLCISSPTFPGCLQSPCFSILSLTLPGLQQPCLLHRVNFPCTGQENQIGLSLKEWGMVVFQTIWVQIY